MSVKSRLLRLAVPAKEDSLSVRVDRIAERYIELSIELNNSWKPPVCAPCDHR